LSSLDEVVSCGGRKNVQPTVRKIAEHARSMLGTDPIRSSWPCPAMCSRGASHRQVYVSAPQIIAAVVGDAEPTRGGRVTAQWTHTA